MAFERYIKVFPAVLLAVILAAGFSAAQSNTSGLFGNATDVEGTQDISEMLDTIPPEELSVDEVTVGNTRVSMIGTEAFDAINTSGEDLRKQVKKLEKGPGRERLIKALQELTEDYMDSFPVQRSLEAFEVSISYANVNAQTYRTRKSLRVTADHNISHAYIMEIIDEELAGNLSDLHFPGKVPNLLQENPLVLEWSLGNLTRGEEAGIFYYVEGIVVGDENFIIGFGDSQKKMREDEPVEITGFTTRDNDKGNIIAEKIGQLGSEFANNIILVSLVAGLILAAGIGVLELEGRGAFDPLKHLACDCESFVRIGFKNTHLIDSYIRECLDSGHHLDDIRMNLIRAGWDRKAVRKLLKKYK